MTDCTLWCNLDIVVRSQITDKKIQYCIYLLFRVVEVHRTCEATATPDKEGACLSE